MKRAVVLLALALVGALGLGLAAPSGAAAVTIPAPPPVNVLPSTLTGALPQGTSSMYGAMTKFIRAFAVEANTQKALKAVEAATATPSQVGLVDKLKGKFKVPAVKLGGLVKGAGAVGIALMADQFFVGLGHGVSEAFGVDVEGNVCGTGAPLVAALSQVDCTEWQLAQDFVPNIDAVSMPAGWHLTDFWWGGTAGIPNPYYVGRFAGEASGRMGTFTAETLVSTFSGTASIRSSTRTVCRNTTSGAFSVASPFWDVVSTVGGIASLSYECAAGSEFWAVGRAVTEGSPGAVLVNPSAPVASQVWFSAVEGAILYFSPASPDWTPEVVGDPERVLRCELTSTTGAKLSADSAAFHESEGAVPPIVCPEFPPEFEVATMTIWEVGGGQSHELYSESVTPEYSAARSAYPECMGGTCLLDLRLTATGASCFEGPAECADWFANPNKGSEYSCHYGQHAVDLAECTIYAPTFMEDATATGNVYGDPVTGEALPGSGVGSELEPGVTDPEQPRECFPTGWGVLNPVEWVMKPVQCALEWAFVPRLSVVQGIMAESSAAWDGTMPRQLIATVSSWAFVPVPPSGCDGITVDVWFLGPPFQIMQACPGDPLESMALWSRIFGNLLFGVYGALAIIRHVAGIIGFEGLGEGKTLE